MKSVTIRHVAEEAGVSLQSVSRVINNGPNVTDALRDRVRAAIDKLGYVPNMAARRMGGSKSYLLIAFNDREPTLEKWRAGRGSDWVAQMLLGAMPRCEADGYHLLLELLDGHQARLHQRVDAIVSSLRPDGVILTPPHSQDAAILDRLDARRVPYARLSAGGGDARGHRIEMDENEAAAVATRHLIGLGHRRIGFLAGSADYAVSGVRLAGFRRAMTEAGLTVAPELVQEGEFSFESGLAAADALLALKDRPTAVIASSDEQALAMLHRAGDAGLAVPDALSLVSFDDTPPVSFSLPALTAIRHPTAAMAERAAALLIEGAAPDGTVHVLPFEFVVRGSTARPG
ncbi:LacI family DNA-binding transcriptional regulator [Sphingomonas quercus]|uniref:LacI family DNA-binding transcriptional regulator n=1 Tax=Sphingomonas quercus TaxID=2842451 RepID=A0ABS6BJD9_9SPHN|nr:LacI family DNA-binding transcriptional regulator [Sphingomonas quercus]MBU3077737.1 LacI family DNA-binding transcriptional regulator [Sphingomonas quercus]